MGSNAADEEAQGGPAEAEAEKDPHFYKLAADPVRGAEKLLPARLFQAGAAQEERSTGEEKLIPEAVADCGEDRTSR